MLLVLRYPITIAFVRFLRNTLLGVVQSRLFSVLSLTCERIGSVNIFKHILFLFILRSPPASTQGTQFRELRAAHSSARTHKAKDTRASTRNDQQKFWRRILSELVRIVFPIRDLRKMGRLTWHGATRKCCLFRRLILEICWNALVISKFYHSYRRDVLRWYPRSKLVTLIRTCRLLTRQ